MSDDTLQTAENDQIILNALTRYHQGDKENAYQMLGQAVLDNPHYHKLPLTMATLLLDDGKHEQALKLLDALPQAIQQKPGLQRVRIELEFSWISQPVKQPHELKAFIENHPDELSAVALLAAWYTTQKEYASALGLFHHIMLRDSDFQDGFGRKSIIKTLSLLEKDDPMIQHYLNLI